VDLYELWLAGEKQLPEVAAQFADAGKKFGLTQAQDGQFWRPAEFSGGGYGPMHAGFVSLRDSMAAVFRDSQSNMELAGQALKLAADEYAATDHKAMEQFRAMRRDLGGGLY
jgi:hypothetical protein